MGAQLAEQARDNVGWKVEAVSFTPARKEEMAFALRRDFEDCNRRIPLNEQKEQRDPGHIPTPPRPRSGSRAAASSPQEAAASS